MNEAKKGHWLPIIAFWSLGIIWGSNFLYMRLASQFITPVQIVFLRVVLSALPIVGYGLIMHSFKREHLKYWYHFATMSLLGAVIYYYCFVVGSHLLYSGIAGAISGSTPLFAFILGIIFLKEEKITYLKILGLIIGLVGIVFLAKPFNATVTDSTWKGVAYMIIGSLSFGASFIYAKKYVTPLKISAVALTAYQLVGATIVLIAITPFKGMWNIFENTNAAIGLILGLAILGTGLAFLIYYYIIDKMGAVKASSVTYIPPIVALIVGATLGSEPIGISDVLGVLLILLGVYFLRRK